MGTRRSGPEAPPEGVQPGDAHPDLSRRDVGRFVGGGLAAGAAGLTSAAADEAQGATRGGQAPFEDTVDPELRPHLLARPVGPEPSIQTYRDRVNATFDSWRAATPRRAGVTIEERRVPGPAGAPEVAVRIYRPRAMGPAAPALLWVHGGGFRIGRYDMDEARCERIADELQCLVVSTEYRLAPENPFPAAPDDVYAALGWLSSQAASLGVDPARIAIGGQSAGGCLAAAVALMARDRNGPPLKFQLLMEPVLDDRLTTVSSHSFTDPRALNRQAVLTAWRDYLGARRGTQVSPYAAPARATDLSGLPPAFVMAGERDPLRDEAIDYARRLMQSDVRTELHVCPGAFHGSTSIAPDAQVSRRAMDAIVGALGRGLQGWPQPPKSTTS